MMYCNLALPVLGCCFFFSLHYFFRFLVSSVFKLGETDAYVISCRAVSACQAIIASLVGVIIASSCEDIMKDVHWLTNTYVYFGFTYFFFDCWAMYQYNVRLYAKSHSHLDRAGSIRLFVMKNKLMIIHHICLPVVLGPIILIYRDNRGDFFFGIFYMIELVVPLLSARAILIQLKMKNSRLNHWIGVLLIVMFLICRILVFPYLYYMYSNYANIPLWLVPSNIPIKCNLSCLSILSLQIYWFSLMLRALKRALFKQSSNTRHDGNFNSISSIGSKLS